ncbi:unnamed protein product [Ilex paraguariensis]|uniref:GDSL esterase/lipase n=1 Tax=Ilex paraguariensis TaxID=185542 RepID=A0ABC8U7Z9_9AQUA
MAKRDEGTYLFLILSLAIFVPHLANATVPAIFVLGDSTADVGTNSLLPDSLARADFPFNGIDFPHSRPTGRFSNGFNSADFLAKLTGFKRSPLLLSLKSGLPNRLCRGVNFASGGSGLLDITGQTLKVVPLSEQIKQFARVCHNLTALRGPASTEKLLSRPVFCISIGSNDIFGYFLTNSTVPKEEFITILISMLMLFWSLYSLGARKFGIISVPTIGCCPAQRIFNSTGGCLEAMNDFSRAVYSALDSLLCKISSELPGMKYSLGNTYEMLYKTLLLSLKVKNGDTACCGFGTLNAEQPCNATANLFSNRRDYLFWDLYHPSQAASRLATITLDGDGPRFVSPINFAQLAEDN